MACYYSDEVEHNVKGPVPAWFCSYLAEHYQHIKVNLEVSANTTYKAAVMLLKHCAEMLLDLGACSFNMYTSAEFVVNVHTQILV